MTFAEQRAKFEKEKVVYESTLLKFEGVDGFDVYNTSIPFAWGGKTYLYGRVERRDEWARSWVRLFEKAAPDTYVLKKDSMIYQLEDPYIAVIGGELVMGGTHVRYQKGELDTYYGYFYRGTDLEDMRYFTTGPDYMKDIRLVELADGRIGVFSRPRGEHITKQYGSESVVGFTIINRLDELSAEVIEHAPLINGLYAEGEWGGCNQCECLSERHIGVLGHHCYMEGGTQAYLNISYVFDYKNWEVLDYKIIGSSTCYPPAPAKVQETADVAFTSGMVARPDGKYDLYSGVGDTCEGRLVIDDPFAAFREA